MTIDDKTTIDPHGRRDRDPIDWAIAAIVVGAASLLLGLEQKVEARRAERNRSVRLKATNGNRVRLRKLHVHMETLQSLVNQIPHLGNFVQHADRKGIRKSSIEFESDEAEERYQRIMDEIGNIIGRVNRLVSEIDLDGLPLTPEDEGEFIRDPLSDIQRLTMEAIHPDVPYRARFQAMDQLLQKYGEFLENLEAILELRTSHGGRMPDE